MRILEDISKSGYFWLPDRPEEKVPGHLTIKNGGKVELELFGLFGGENGYFEDNVSFDRIIGHIENDGLVTLDNCFYLNKSYAFGGVSKSRVCVNFMYSGVAYEKDEAPTFNTLSFSVDCLDEWVGISGISVTMNPEKRTANINYEPQTNLLFNIDDQTQLQISFTYTLPGFPNLTEAKITQRIYLKIISKKLLSTEILIEYAYKVVNLLCFASDQTVSIKDVTATSTEILQNVHEGEQRPVPIRLYYQSSPFSDKEPIVKFFDMLFTFGRIKEKAELIINNWINAYEDLSPSLGLYFSVKSGAQKHYEGRFLALAQGLETFHRRTSQEKLMGSDDFSALVDEVMKACPPGKEDWLRGRLEHGNEINLRKRITRIIEPFKDIIGNSASRRKIISKIVDTRNYLTHYNEDLKSSAASGFELYTLCRKMEAIFQLQLLKVLEFSEAEILMVARDCQSLKQKLSET